MTEVSSLEDVLDLYERRGHEHLGEAVSQLAHALQCAALARADGAPEGLVCAALLHDVGHLVAEPDKPSGSLGADDGHEAVGARLLGALFGPSVAAPVALHVTAKRWRCAVDPAYTEDLSTASQASLRSQGGPLDEAACRRFEAHPASAHAIALRTWDDAAKDPEARAGSMRDYELLLTSLLLRSERR